MMNKRPILMVVTLIVLAIISGPKADGSQEPIGTLLKQANAYQSAKEYAKAVELYTQIIARDPNQTEAYWQRGRIYGLQRQYDAALADFRQVTVLQPDHAQAYGNWCWYLIVQEQSAEARIPCQKIYELTPEDYKGTLLLGHTYLLTGDRQTARAYYEKALPFITTDTDRQIALAYFAQFIKNGWQVEACRQEIAWMEHAFAAQTEQPDPSARENDALRQKLHADVIATLRETAEGHHQAGRNEEAASTLNMLGGAYESAGQYETALQCYQQALELNRQLQRAEKTAVSLNNIGIVNRILGRYAEARDAFEEALKIARGLNDQRGIMYYLGNLGGVYKKWGRYDKAAVALTQTLELARIAGTDVDVADALNDVGLVYDAWGQYDRAQEYCQQALELARTAGDDEAMTRYLSSVGVIATHQQQFESARQAFEQALELERERVVDHDARMATALNNLGAIYLRLQDYAQAAQYLEQALAHIRSLGKESSLAVYLNNLGNVYLTWEQYDKAREFFLEALALARRLDEKANMARYLHNLGVLYMRQEQCQTAIPYLAEAVAILEQIRKTATGDVRRDYFASQIATYQDLIACYLKLGDFDNAFRILELSRAKRLNEQLRGTDTEAYIPTLEQIQQALPADTAILIYAATERSDMLCMAITRERITTSQQAIDNFMSSGNIADRQDSLIAAVNARGLGLAEAPTQTTAAEPVQPLDLKTLIQTFRTQLMASSASRGLDLSGDSSQKSPEPGTDSDTNAQLYALLLGEVEYALAGKTHLIILPDGLLNFLPFETLRDTQGTYLVEKYYISYTHSLGVLELIKQRRYPADRKPLLAFGGAVYAAQSYDVEMVSNDAQFAYLRTQVDYALNQGQPLGPLYAQLRRGDWGNLPGTLHEVNAIRQVVNQAEIRTGRDVNEIAVKTLSTQGVLAQYHALHFATHGNANPDIPELSALVLSLEGEPASAFGEDGYLRAGEVAEMKLKADFVNLSACETGLGRLYSGEGMVGLTQAFLIAGANGLSVSLWQVADESTAAFMTALYKLVEEQGLSYAEAIVAVKRHFIAGDFGDAWKAPYYWAPFVYYGRR